MRKRIKWSEDFKIYPGYRQPRRGFRGVGKAILHGLLVLSAFCAIYAFFHKTELNPAVVESSAVEAKPDEAGTMDSLGEASLEDGFQDEDIG
jgi:hypothetical protein